MKLDRYRRRYGWLFLAALVLMAPTEQMPRQPQAQLAGWGLLTCPGFARYDAMAPKEEEYLIVTAQGVTHVMRDDDTSGARLTITSGCLIQWRPQREGKP